jgi:hypothetical protein
MRDQMARFQRGYERTQFRNYLGQSSKRLAYCKIECRIICPYRRSRSVVRRWLWSKYWTIQDQLEPAEGCKLHWLLSYSFQPRYRLR